MSGRRRRPRGAAVPRPAPATRHELELEVTGHVRAAAGRLLAELRVARIDTLEMRRELVQQLELAHQDLDLARVAAELLAAERPPRR